MQIQPNSMKRYGRCIVLYKGEEVMNYKIAAAWCAMMLCSSAAMASSPIPTFDKEAVTVHPYQRTGQQEKTLDMQGIDDSKLGNTGTAEHPTFYVQKIIIDSTTPDAADSDGTLQHILDSYSHRSISVEEMSALTAKVTEYYRTQGYTVPQAVVPPQEVENGVLKIHVYTAKYDTITLTKNESDVKDSVLQRYIHNLKVGETIKDKPLELAMNNLNDLPAVTARAVLAPGTQRGTTKLGIEVLRRPVWNNYVFFDNGGGYYSGKYRYGFHTEINNPAHMGDKIILSGMLTNHDVKNYSMRYELPVGCDGTRWGIGWSQSSYELHTNNLYDSLGQSRGISWYGLTPLYRDRMNRLTLLYGYDHRSIRDRQHLNILSEPEIVTDKTSNVWHIGVSGSQYYPNQFTQYDVIYWLGRMHTDDHMGSATNYDGTYHKLTGDLLTVWYDGPWNYRINASGQLANRSLDGSEQFYLGGMNGVRAYGASDGYGDAGYLVSGEIRRQTGIKNLEAAVFIDTAGAKLRSSNPAWDHLSGWGVGLRYQKPDDWNIQLDYAWKIHARDDRTEPDNHNGRLWLQVYKMF